MTRPGLRTMALASVLVASIAGAACGSDPVEPGAPADAADAGGAAVTDAAASDAAISDAWEAPDPRVPSAAHALGAAEHLPETWVSGDTLVPWAEQTMRWADAWSVCLAGGEVVRDIDTRLEHDQELWWVDGFVAYPPCVAYHDWRLDLNERAVFPSCADEVLTDAALDACAQADDCQVCLTALAEANKRACSPAARILLALEQWCRPDRYDYRELWGR